MDKQDIMIFLLGIIAVSAVALAILLWMIYQLLTLLMRP